MFTAIPTLVRALGFSESQSVWLVSGYQITFASFLLMVSAGLHKSGLHSIDVRNDREDVSVIFTILNMSLFLDLVHLEFYHSALVL
jgi:hypothetical protein